MASLLVIAGRDGKEKIMAAIHGGHEFEQVNDLAASVSSLEVLDADVDVPEHDDPKLDRYVLWKEMRKQVKILKEEMDKSSSFRQ